MPREDIYKKTNQKGVDGVLRDHSLWYRSPGLAPALKGAGMKRLPEPGRKVSVSKLPWGWGDLCRGTQLMGSAFRGRARGTSAASSHLQLGLNSSWSHKAQESIKGVFLGQAAGAESRMETSGEWTLRGNWKNCHEQEISHCTILSPVAPNWSPCFRWTRIPVRPR